MKIIIIAAVADNGIIGAAGQIPWHISDDLKRFKRLTLGSTIIMGRKTFVSLGRPLPGRRNLVLSRSLPPVAGITVFADLATALEDCRQRNEPAVFIIGGAEVYRQALPVADILQLTHVHQQPAGNVHFPPLDLTAWTAVAREEHPGYSFAEYHRR